jgi:penicillin amidase
MWRILRWTLGSILVLALVPVAGAVAFWFHLSWNQPSMSGNATLAGLRAPVTVVRDGNAVPHVFADHVDDAYFALGWLHAQDRLFQMEMMRRVGAGRLSELIGFLGDFPVRIDTMMRTLGLYRHAEASMAHLSPEVRAGLDAYAAGVNAWLGARTVPLRCHVARVVRCTFSGDTRLGLEGKMHDTLKKPRHKTPSAARSGS